MGTQTYWNRGRTGLESGAPQSFLRPSFSVPTAAEPPPELPGPGLRLAGGEGAQGRSLWGSPGERWAGRGEGEG